MKTVMKVAQYYTVFNYGNPRPQNHINSRDKTIVVGTGNNSSPKFVLTRNSTKKFGKEIPPDAFLMDKSETSLSTTVDKSHVKKVWSIL